MNRTLLIGGILLSVGLLLSAGPTSAQEKAAPAPAPAQPVSPFDQAYRLVVDDAIQIVIEGHPEMNQEYTVPENGVVSMPPIGRLMLKGRSVEDLEKEVRSRFQQRGQLTDPSVFVMIRKHAPRQAFLIGAVTLSIALPVYTKYGIVEILSMAGANVATNQGVGGADLRNVTIMRKRENGDPFRFTVNVEDVLYRGDFKKNVIVMPNDIIHIPLLQNASTSAAVYVLGKVGKPGKYPFNADREQMTLTKLIALAGDFHQFADEGSIKILRKEGNRTRGIEVDFDEIIDLEEQDVVLRPDDLVYVPESPI